MNLCSGAKMIAKVIAHRIGSKNGLRMKIKASVAAIKSVKKKMCLIKIETFKLLRFQFDYSLFAFHLIVAD